MSRTREQRLDLLRNRKRAQVLVVGGGINGISTFRELALNGVDVVLVERGDFMSGASSAPSRMIHGGLRYMENGEFALVKESLRERNLLLQNAPHLVGPLPTVIPIAHRFSGIVSAARRFLGGNVAPGDRGALIVKLGLSLYDLYAGRESGMPRHRFLNRRETQERWPALRRDLVGSAIYHDARISHPERLGIELVLDAERETAALAVNHVGLVSLGPAGTVLEDRLGGERIALDADIVVNATGAWIDLTNSAMSSMPPQLISGTKGSHLVIANRELCEAVGEEMVYFANREGRVCILFTHLGNVLAGSTDISVETPEGVRCEDDETDYILASIGEVFPGITIDRGEIIYRFAGVRPLPHSDGKVNANISRDHSCEWLADNAGAARPVLNLIGGKWTTFRAFGEEAADLVMARVGAHRRTSTRDARIGGGQDYPEAGGRQKWIADLAAESGVGERRIADLLARYGTRARAVALREAKAGASQVQSLPAYSRQEIEWLIEAEHVVTLRDLVLRRMTIVFTTELSFAAISELSGIAATALGWDEARRTAEVADLLQILYEKHGLPEKILRSRDPDWKEDDVRRQESPHESPVRKRQMS